MVDSVLIDLNGLFEDYSLIILNQTIKLPLGAFKALWHRAKVRICADGAANKLKDYALKEKSEFVPQIICGDFDSVSKETLEFFSQSAQMKSECQNTTDLQKCLKLVHGRVLILGGFQKRFDQVISNVNAVLRHPDCFMLDKHNLLFRVPPVE